MTATPIPVEPPALAPRAPDAACRVTLAGGVVLGGGTLRFSAAVGGGQPVVLRGGLARGTIDLTAMFTELLGSGWLQVPPDFPQVTLLAADVTVSPGVALSFKATSEVGWEKPFGAMTGVAMTKLRLAFSNDAAGTQVGFSATTEFGRWLTLSGALLFQGGELVVAGVTLDDELPIADFLSWSVPGVDWGELLPVKLGPATTGQPMRLYYAKQGWQGWKQGFNIDNARIDVLGYGANLDLHVDGGVELSGSLQMPIDLGFMRVHGPESQATSPVLSAGSQRNGGRWFSLGAGVTFLQEPFGKATVAVETIPGAAGHQLAATISHKGTIGPFVDPEFAFTWSRQRGFRVATWPMPNFPGDEYVDLVTTLNKLSGSACAPFVKAMINEAIETSFDFSASMGSPAGTTGPDGEDAVAASALSVTVSGTYNVKARGRPEVLFSVPLPTDLHLSLTTPEQMSFAALAKALGDAIGDAALDLLRQVVNDPARAAKFFGVVAAPGLIAQVLAMVVCRGWTPVPPVIPVPPVPPPPIPPAPPYIGPPFVPPPPVPPNAPGDITADPPRYADGTVVVTFGPAARATSYTAYAWWPYDDADKGVKGQVTAGGSPVRIPVSEAWRAGQYEISVHGRNSAGGGPWSTHQIIRLAPLTFTGMAQEGLGLALSCSPTPDGTQYEWQVILPSGDVGPRSVTSEPQLRVPISRSSPAGRYSAIVRSLKGDTAIPSPWSVPADCLVDPGQHPGWLVVLRNDTAPPSAWTITAVVTQPPTGTAIPVAPGGAALLSSIPVQRFEVWRTVPLDLVPGHLLALGHSVVATTSGDSITLTYRQIDEGRLPAGFTATLRRGIAVGNSMPLWSDATTPETLASGVWAALRDATAVAAAVATVYTPPVVRLAPLVAVVAPHAPDAGALARALVAVRDIYAPFEPVTPVSVAVALRAGWPSPAGPLEPETLATALVAAFAGAGITVTVPELATALVAAYHPPVTGAGLTPVTRALKACGAGLTPAVAALTGAVPGVNPVALAGAAKAAYLGPTPTVAEYAEALAAEGRTAQEATPLLMGSYPATPLAELTQVLLTAFPSTTAAPVLLAWCLAVAGASVGDGVVQLRVAFDRATAAELAAAGKTAWPAPDVAATIDELLDAGATATEAAAILAATYPDLTPTQVAWVLLVRFAATAPDARALVAALAGAGQAMPATARAVHRLLPLAGAPALAAMCKSAYLGGSP